MNDDNPSVADPLGAIADEFVQAFRQGKRPSVADFAQRYPDHAAEIREMLPALVLMEKAKTADSSLGQSHQAGTSTVAAPLQQLGDYRILREVGRGGMGVVYEAQQLSLGRHVAIKVLPSHAMLDPRRLARFQREARSAGRLHHTNIVPVFGVGEQDGLHYFVMQFIPGLGLDRVMDELRRLRPLRHRTAPTREGAPGCVTNLIRDDYAGVVARSLITGEFTASHGSQPSEASGGCKPPDSDSAQNQGADTPRSLAQGVDTPRSPNLSATVRMPGHDESSTLTESGYQYWQSIARVGMQVADALAYAAGQGVLHRDIKPSNLLLDDAGNVWVTDFGLAKADSDGDNLTHTGDIVGTLRYVAPERFNGHGDVRSDVYSLGLTLYELLTLRTAFDETDSNRLVKQVMHDEPPRPRKLNQGIPRDLETVVLKAIARDAGHRYQTPSELAEDLKRFVEDRPVHARRIGEAERAWRWCRRNPLPASLAAGIVLVFLAGFAGVCWQWRAAASQQAEAEKQAGIALDREREAEQKTRDEARARTEAQRFAADLLLERGLGSCKQGQYAGGLLWLARGLEVVPDEANDLRDSLRTLLGGWSTRLCRCPLVLDHPGSVKSADLSADGRLVATASGKAAQVWDAATGRTIGPPLRHAARVLAVAISPDGRLLLSGGEDSVARLWETVTGRPVGKPLVHGNHVEHVAFSPDGKVAVTAAKDGTARLWDSATGMALGLPLAHVDVVRAVAFSPDGRLVATGSNDATARLWEVPTGRPHGEPLRHTGAVRGLAFSPDGRQLLTGSNDKTARTWDVASGKALLTFRHAGPVPGVAFRPDGRAVATASEDYTAREWDSRTGQPLAPPLPHLDEVSRTAYSPDSRLLLTAYYDGPVFSWEVGTDRPAFAPLPRGRLSRVAFGIDSRTIVTAGPDHTARLWRIWKPLLPDQFPRFTGPVVVTAFSSDGTVLLAASGRQAWLYNATTGQPIAGPLDHPDGVLAGVISPDGRTALTGSFDGSARTWEVASGRRLAGPFRHAHPVWAVAFRPDGKAFATGSGYSRKRDGRMLGVGEARVWDVASGKVIQSAPRHAREVQAVVFTPDGRTLVTGSKDGTVRFWDAATGATFGGVIRHDGWVNALALTTDGRAVLTGSDDHTARLWSVPAGSPLTTPLRHGQQVKAVAISPDNRLLLTTSEDATARLWEARRGQPAGELLQAPAPIHSAAFSPTGRAFVTGDRNGKLLSWRVPAPLGGDVERLRLWIETTSGTELDASGALRELNRETFNVRRRRLAKLGGAPPGAEE
jgi:WD40 repeat protein/serine/threonine protein kinase